MYSPACNNVTSHFSFSQWTTNHNVFIILISIHLFFMALAFGHLISEQQVCNQFLRNSRLLGVRAVNWIWIILQKHGKWKVDRVAVYL